MNTNSENFWNLVKDKEKMKKEFITISYFITLYENFKNIWKERILDFYADTKTVDENNNLIYEFTKPNPNNPKAFEEGDFIKDIEEENKYKEEVYGTIKKKNGKRDHEASLFNWMLSRDLIKKEHYESLLIIRNIRNKLVHELDKLLFDGLPNNLSKMLSELISIRKYSSNKWYIKAELPTIGNAELDDDGKIIEPDNVTEGINIIYDIIYDTIMK